MDKSISSRFQIRKQKLLEQLDAPAEEYHDLSPKGSVDEPIRALIHDVNQLAGLVTTSSCSGRISVFLEGRKADASQAEPSDLSVAGPGGKGGGGSWLFISHNAISVSEDAASRFVLPELNLKKRESADSKPDIFSRYIHLKFEPMVWNHCGDGSLLTLVRSFTS
jgi:tRNA wybutosine-synthesizing protein 3